MFEQASRVKLKFKLNNGIANVDDLWDLSLESLDSLARQLNKTIKDEEDISFIKEKSSANKLTELRFEIVKHVIAVKLAEKEKAKDSAAKSERKQAILKILSDKEYQSLQATSKEDLLKELESLG